MKQFQFEVKNHNNLRKELARVKRFAKNEYYSSIFFQVYTTLENFEEITQVTNIIDQEFPESGYYGCQTLGNIIEGRLSASHTIIVCTVFEFDSTNVEFFYIDPIYSDSRFQSLQELWDYCNENIWVKGVELTCSFKGAELLGIGNPIESLREEVRVFGGVAADPRSSAILDTYVFAKGCDYSSTASIAVVFGGPDVFVETDYVRGWEGLGKTFTITDCDGKRVHKIDDEPAMNIYRKYLNIEQDDTFSVNAMTFPLLVKNDEVDCIREPLACDNKDEFELSVNVEKGTKVRLSYGEKSTILKSVRKKIRDIVRFAPDSICIYSCSARRVFWGDDEISKETLVFDDFAPTIGFYTRGEILRVGNVLQYLNSTMVMAIVREGEAYDFGFEADEVLVEDDASFVLGPKLINYISAVTGEIQGQYNSTMRGMANIYKNLFLIDLDERSIFQLDNDEVATKCFKEKENYFEKFKNFIRTITTESNTYDALMFCDVHTLKPRLRYKDVIAKEIVSKDLGWFRAQFIVINRNSSGMPNQFVFTTQIIDEEKKASKQQQGIIESLADIYFTLHLFDLEKDKVTEVSTQELVHRIYSENCANGCQRTLNAVISQTVSEEFVEQMMEFVDLSTLEERMRGRKIISTELICYAGWAKVSFIEVEGEISGKLQKVLFTVQIIDDEKKKEETLVRRAMTDELTGLYNRRAYEIDLEDASQKAARDIEFAIVAIDVNGLKNVNDTLGHEAGDELIIGAANCIEKVLSPYGKSYRIGGDEFAGIIYVPKSELETIRINLLKAVDEWHGIKVEKLSMSCGFVSSSDFAGEAVTEISKAADKEMYADKEEFYKSKGHDRRGHLDACDMIYKTYSTILKANLTKDSYEVIKSSKVEDETSKALSDENLSKWLCERASLEKIHSDDLDEYLSHTSIEYLRDYFAKDMNAFCYSYRRCTEAGYRKRSIEIVADKNFTNENMSAFLYIRDF